MVSYEVSIGAAEVSLPKISCHILDWFLWLLWLQGKDAIFIVTAKRLQDIRRHATIESIPVPPRVPSKAPLYSKKSEDDADVEWIQHHAKRWTII